MTKQTTRFIYNLPPAIQDGAVAGHTTSKRLAVQLNAEIKKAFVIERKLNRLISKLSEQK